MDAIRIAMKQPESSDPALLAATRALSRPAARHTSRFTSLELSRSGPEAAPSRSVDWAPIGYAASVVSALGLAVTLWLI